MREGNKFNDIVDPSIIHHFDQYTNFDTNFFISLLTNISIPKRSCYNEILYQIQFDCEDANDEQQKILALHFTQCYYNITGRIDQFPTGVVDELKTSQMSASVYSTFTSMKAHWKNLCLFAKQNVFTEETSQTLVDLYDTMIESMKSIIDLQKELNETAQLLNDSLYNISIQINKTIENINNIEKLFDSFTIYFDIIKKFIDTSINTIHSMKIYAEIAILIVLLIIYFPKLINPLKWLKYIFNRKGK